MYAGVGLSNLGGRSSISHQRHRNKGKSFSSCILVFVRFQLSTSNYWLFWFLSGLSMANVCALVSVKPKNSFSESRKPSAFACELTDNPIANTIAVESAARFFMFLYLVVKFVIQPP